MSSWGEFGWTFIPKAEKVCRTCRQPIKRMDDVFSIGRLYPSNQRYLICNGCRPQALTTHPRS